MTMDDPFEQIVAGLECEITIPDRMMSVRDLNDAELSSALNDVRQELLERGEMQVQTTDKGRALQSLRAALIIEVRRRQAERR
jgi:hypothetical protein